MLPGTITSLEHFRRYGEDFFVVNVPGSGLYQYHITGDPSQGGALTPVSIFTRASGLTGEATFGAADFIMFFEPNGTMRHDVLPNPERFTVSFDMGFNTTTPERLSDADIGILIDSAVIDTIKSLAPNTELVQFLTRNARMFDSRLVDIQRAYARKLLVATPRVVVRITDTTIHFEFVVEREQSAVAATDVLSRTTSADTILEKIQESTRDDNTIDLAQIEIPTDTIEAAPDREPPSPPPPQPPPPASPPPPSPPRKKPLKAKESSVIPVFRYVGIAGGVAAFVGLAGYGTWRYLRYRRNKREKGRHASKMTSKRQPGNPMKPRR